MNEGEFAIWWHDEAGSTHIHGVTFTTAEEAAAVAKAKGYPAPMISPL